MLSVKARRVKKFILRGFLLVMLLLLATVCTSCREKGTAKHTGKQKEKFNHRESWEGFSKNPDQRKIIVEEEELKKETCANLEKRFVQIWEDGCKRKEDRQLAVKLAQTVHCRCLNGEGKCCSEFTGISYTLSILFNILTRITNEYIKKACRFGYATSCLTYLTSVSKLGQEEKVKIWSEEIEFVAEIKRLCKAGDKYACIYLVHFGSALYSIWKEKDKKEYALGLIHKYGIDLCSPDDMDLCGNYASTLVSINKDLYVAYDIYRHKCEELRNAAACSVLFQMAHDFEDANLTYEEQFDLRWKSVMYSNEAHEMVDGWLRECYEDQGKPVKDRKYKKFAEKCIQWEKRLKEFERKKAKPEKDQVCNFSYKEFLCPKEMIEPKEKREVSPYFKLIKDHLEPPVSIQKLIEKSESRADQKPKGNPKPRERPESDGSAK